MSTLLYSSSIGRYTPNESLTHALPVVCSPQNRESGFGVNHCTRNVLAAAQVLHKILQE